MPPLLSRREGRESGSNYGSSSGEKVIGAPGAGGMLGAGGGGGGGGGARRGGPFSTLPLRNHGRRIEEPETRTMGSGSSSSFTSSLRYPSSQQVYSIGYPGLKARIEDHQYWQENAEKRLRLPSLAHHPHPHQLPASSSRRFLLLPPAPAAHARPSLLVAPSSSSSTRPRPRDILPPDSLIIPTRRRRRLDSSPPRHSTLSSHMHSSQSTTHSREYHQQQHDRTLPPPHSDRALIPRDPPPSLSKSPRRRDATSFITTTTTGNNNLIASGGSDRRSTGRTGAFEISSLLTPTDQDDDDVKDMSSNTNAITEGAQQQTGTGREDHVGKEEKLTDATATTTTTTSTTGDRATEDGTATAASSRPQDTASSSNSAPGGPSQASSGGPGPGGRWEEAIDPALRAAEERKAAYAWENRGDQSSGPRSAGQDAMGINSLMDADKQSERPSFGADQVGGPRSPYPALPLSNTQLRRDEPRRGEYEGPAGQGSNGNKYQDYQRREIQEAMLHQQQQQQQQQDQYQQQSSRPYYQSQQWQPSGQQGGPPGAQGASSSRPNSTLDGRPIDEHISNLPQVLRNAPPTLAGMNTGRAGSGDNDGRTLQSPVVDGYRGGDHGSSLNMPGFQEYLARGLSRFSTGAEQAAYRAGFEEAWEYRTKYMEEERARRQSLNMSTAPPTSSLRTTDNNPGPSPAKEDQPDLPGSRLVSEYVGYDGWDRDGRDYGRDNQWSAGGQDRSYQQTGSSGLPANEGYKSTYGATPQAPYGLFRPEASPMNNSIYNTNNNGHSESRQDRSADSMTPNSKARKSRPSESRQAISCNMCRQRKSKCDGNPPYPCGPCTKKGTDDQCQYAQFVRRRGPAKKKGQGSNEDSNSPPPVDMLYSLDQSHRSQSGSARRYDDQGGRDESKRMKM